MKIRITGDKQFDKVGDEYLQQEDVKLDFDNDCAEGYIRLVIDEAEHKPIFLSKKDLKWLSIMIEKS